MPEYSSQLMDASAPAKTTNTAATPPVYVIVGNGFSSVVNHLTLRLSRWGEARLRGAEVWHIYQLDPWPTYIDHDMGQWTDLLTLPGFTYTPTGATNKYLRSTEFGKLTGREFANLPQVSPKFKQRQGTIEKIERVKVNGTKKFSIKLKDDNKPIIADFVDICTGPGEARLTKQATRKKQADDFKTREILFDKELYKEYSDPNPVGRVVTAHAYMKSACKRRIGNVCVFGLGPLAAGCVELALANNCSVVYWVGKRLFNDSFAPGRRYDALAKLENGTTIEFKPGPPPDSVVLFPVDSRLWFAEGYKAARVRVTRKKRTANDYSTEDIDWDDDTEPPDDGSVDAQRAKERLLEIKLSRGSPGPGRKDRFVDRDKNDKKRDQIVVDQLIISASSQELEDEPGAAAFLAKLIRKDEGGKFKMISCPPPRKNVPGVTKVSFGVQSEDGKFRVLGSAGHIQPDRAAEDNSSSGDSKPSRLTLYEKSLPDQARVEWRGVTMSAASVAQANGFFQKQPNDCVNIAHPGELVAVWGMENGNKAYEMRRQRVDPFTKEGSSRDDAKFPLGSIPRDYYRYGPPSRYK
jgi:hypothetical protein